MIYRIILSIGYNKAWFDFNNIEEAGEFAKTILTHQSANEDRTKRDSVRLEIIDPTIVEDKEEEKE